MIETRNRHISAEKILERADELACRHNLESRFENPLPREPMDHRPLGGPPPIDSGRSRYHLNDFLARHDLDFIECAYLGLLKRPADPTSIERYLEALRTGRLTKSTILGHLRYSPEGRNAGVHVEGLARSRFLQRCFSIPVIGYVLNLTAAVLRLPSLLRHLRALENNQYVALEQHRAHYNASFDTLVTRIAEIDDDLARPKPPSHYHRELAKVRMALQENRRDFELCRARLAEQRRAIEQSRERLQAHSHFLEQCRSRLDQIVDAADNPAHDSFYLAFENVFRGSREAISERLQPHLGRLAPAPICDEAPLLDIGCGRGEWLELLRAQGLPARGIDLNETMVSLCREQGLDVVRDDALRHLRALPDGSLGAVSAFHLVEHLPFATLIDLLDEILRVLRPGGLVLIETPNPENLLVGACTFYRDPTHRNPLHPETAHFLLAQRGFACPEICGINPADPGVTDDPLLKSLFFGAQDYLLLGWKEGAGSESPL